MWGTQICSQMRNRIGSQVEKMKQAEKRAGRADEMRRELAARIQAHTGVTGPNADGPHETAIAGLTLSRRPTETACYRVTYEPSLAVFAQGKKRVNLGGTLYVCPPGSFLLTSIDVPVESQIIEASAAVPMLSLLLRLDMAMVREILAGEELPDAEADTRAGREAGREADREADPGARARGTALAVGETTAGLLDACSRLVGLLDAPRDIPFLSRLVQREIVYRILRTPQGERLRAIATTGDLSNRTAKAVAWLKTNYAKPLHMDELAEVARMGVSTLHHQFRALTAMSPLQYQKQLRLQTARQRMLLEGMDATSAAFEVGYESVSQFNREYSRLFGQPPMRDVKALRVTPPSGFHAAS
jgi:AraC-like DNA-binding protein